MHILIIGYVWPEPNSSAAGSRMMQLINSLQAEHFTISFATPAQKTEHMVNLDALGIKTTQITLNHSSFDDYVIELNPDVVIFDRFMMEEQFAWRIEKHCPDALRVLNTEDLHSLRHARHKAVKSNKDFELKNMHTDLGLREIAAILRSDLTLMISAYEYTLLQDKFNIPQYQLMHLPFMLPSITQSDLNTLPSFEQRQHFISIGNFRHEPNWDAVLQLKTEIWPKIRQALPQAQMHIYGAYPPPKATQLHNEKQGFLIKGWARDANQVMQQSRICLAPIRFGAGIKGKLVEAMLNGTGSITTPVGAESMHGELAWNGEICDSNDDFVNAAISLYQDKSAWQLSQQKGLAILTTYYHKDEWHKKFIARLNDAKAAQSENRQQNFMGLMVRHHSLKSTQYMSQWIEAKNKPNKCD
ncbi:putative glycosyltransferase [Marinomonas sp. MED121]|uniref:glycosyltransferase n=1 Tax=Marinomonas sp. MED121 TaxID=314277 RepID=UPI000068FF7E|nr:glycosyltransferase [Marinomonas sp. MED121]EAQ66988.1 putative glycosyltransferase [Marinomonas sp. MED121]